MSGVFSAKNMPSQAGLRKSGLPPRQDCSHQVSVSALLAARRPCVPGNPIVLAHLAPRKRLIPTRRNTEDVVIHEAAGSLPTSLLDPRQLGLFVEQGGGDRNGKSESALSYTSVASCR